MYTQIYCRNCKARVIIGKTHRPNNNSHADQVHQKDVNSLLQIQHRSGWIRPSLQHSCRKLCRWQTQLLAVSRAHEEIWAGAMVSGGGGGELDGAWLIVRSY
eukprot:COSAG01_NODE_4422_length_5037_cov_79.147226_2_plen_102_part_00